MKIVHKPTLIKIRMGKGTALDHISKELAILKARIARATMQQIIFQLVAHSIIY